VNVLLAKAMILGIEATGLAADGNNPIMANNLSKQVEVSFTFWFEI
jgi:hypothetical protein